MSERKSLGKRFLSMFSSKPKKNNTVNKLAANTNKKGNPLFSANAMSVANANRSFNKRDNGGGNRRGNGGGNNRRDNGGGNNGRGNGGGNNRRDNGKEEFYARDFCKKLNKEIDNVPTNPDLFLKFVSESRSNVNWLNTYLPMITYGDNINTFLHFLHEELYPDSDRWSNFLNNLNMLLENMKMNNGFGNLLNSDQIGTISKFCDFWWQQVEKYKLEPNELTGIISRITQNINGIKRKQYNKLFRGRTQKRSNRNN
jgi:hypothetical protein